MAQQTTETLDQEMLEGAFLMLALLPDEVVEELAGRAAGADFGPRRAPLPETSYEMSAGKTPSSAVWDSLWRGYMAMEAPGMSACAGLQVPSYPLPRAQDVNRVTLDGLSRALWAGVGHVRREVDPHAA